MSRKTEKKQYNKRRSERRKTNTTQKRNSRDWDKTYDTKPTYGIYERLFRYKTEPMSRTDKRNKKERQRNRTEKRFYR